MAVETIPFRLQQQARNRPNAPAYHVRQDGRWVPTSYAQYAGEVRQAGKALIALGLKPGATVCILGFNRPEWLVMDLACMSVGGAPAGIYTTSSSAEVQYIVHHAESPLVLIENHEQWEKIREQKKNLPLLKHVVVMRGVESPMDPLALTWDEFLSYGDGIDDSDLDVHLQALKPNDLATLIYTSGTTGPPKGVMLSHRNLAWTADAAVKIVGGVATDTNLSYLPLSHIAEQMFTLHGPITMGSSIYFAESIEKVPDNLKEVQPTIVFGVPRIWEKFHAGVSARLHEATGFKKTLVEWVRRVAVKVIAARGVGRMPGALLGLQYALAKKLVLAKLHPALGLGSARICVSGAAPIGVDVLEFFASLDILILEVYGQSEDCGPTSFNLPNRFKLGSVGLSIPGVEVKIAEDGEILVKGPNVFLGYYKDPEATAETLMNGWLHSGDLGSIDEQGFLFITGRIKEIIITAGGKNITPKNIEFGLMAHELVGQAFVVGDRRKYLTALITLEPDAAKRFADKHKLDASTLHENAGVRGEMQKLVDEVNQTLARVEQIKKFEILSRPFSVEDGELTPTLKIKRRVVTEHFAQTIEEMYRE